MSLYNLKSADGNWRVTKFSNDLEVESSYITTMSECECPAGSRPTCRHRQMLPKMLAVGAEDSASFYDFERDQFFEPIQSSERSDTDFSPNDTVLEATFPIPLAEGVAPQASELANTGPTIIDDVGEVTEEMWELPSVHTGPSPNIYGTQVPEVHPTIGHIKRRI